MSTRKKRLFAPRRVKADSKTGRLVLTGLATVALTASLVVLPVAFDREMPGVGSNDAMAKGGPGGGAGAGNGGGNGNGNGGGNAASGGNGQGNATASATNGSNNNGKSASLMGSLNAAHAAPQALANANENSRVGQIAIYSSAIQANDVESAAAALAEASNKDDGIVESVVHAVNSLLGIDSAEVDMGEATGEASATAETGEEGVTAEAVTVHSLETDVVSAIQGPAPEPEAPATP